MAATVYCCWATPPCPSSTGNTASVRDAGAGTTYVWSITGGTVFSATTPTAAKSTPMPAPATATNSDA